ncbi:hypothetical protein [Planctomicrobium piriforme]|uniref:hypothetical protein n=1 Tax=Planctomicrobium piriforme TaxID=1576369 RepID=UPI000B863E23|nr:hypothetical protein [Planctomicrobium piriforme]
MCFAAAISWQAAFVVACLVEADRLRTRLLEQATAGSWWEGPALDGTWWVPLLAMGPFCWFWKIRREGIERLPARQTLRTVSRRCLILGGCVVAITSLLTTLHAGNQRLESEPGGPRFSQVVPIIHDEFSYQLQARTFLAGRWSWEPPPHARELFHQLHVLNEDRFASRYLPGTGLWIVPWLAIGQQVWGQMFANMLIAGGIYVLGVQIAGFGVGVTAGMLTALSPDLALFGNLLLAHQPALAGLICFLNAAVCYLRGGPAGWMAMGGVGLTLAMLCRPLTAAAIALPWGVVLLRGWLKAEFGQTSVRCSVREWRFAIAALGIPILAGLLLVGWQSHSLTGSVFTTAYSHYTELYTPRHAYGFEQASNLVGAEHPRVLREYNDWAVELTPGVALQNCWDRLCGSLEWSLGLVPLTFAAVFVTLTIHLQSRWVRLVLASILCLHVAHVPYWLNGILKHHYVFESGPLWLLLLAVAGSQCLDLARKRGAVLFPAWGGTVLVMAVAGNLFSLDGDETTSRLAQGVKQLARPSAGYREFERILARACIEKPALVLIRPQPGDLHAQYVRNSPPFDGELLVGMDRPELYSHGRLSELFPDRSIYFYDSTSREVTLLQTSNSRFVRRPE